MPYGLVLFACLRALKISAVHLNVGTTHIPYGTVYIVRRRAVFVLHYLSAIAETSQLL